MTRFSSAWVLFLAFVAEAIGQNPIRLEDFDGFSLASEVLVNKELAVSLGISEDSKALLRDFLKTPEVLSIRKEMVSLRSSPSGGRFARLDEAILEQLGTKVPNFKTEKVRAWAIKTIFRTPEIAFLSPKVHQYLDLDTASVKVLVDFLRSDGVSMQDNRNAYEMQRMELRKERAKYIVETFPFEAQVLFSRYAGSELLGKYELDASAEGPLELVTEAIHHINVIVLLVSDPQLKERLKLTEEQLTKITGIDNEADKRIYASVGKVENQEDFRATVRKQEFKDIFDVLSVSQNRRLQQWIGNLYFVADPKRELSRVRLRTYLGFDDNQEWKETMRFVDKQTDMLDEKLAQFNSVIVAKLMSTLQTKKDETSRLFKGVW